MGRAVHHYDTWTLYEDAGSALLRAAGDPTVPFAAIHRAHEAIVSAHVPRVIEASEQCLRFDCAPVCHMGMAIRDGARRRESANYAEAVAFNEIMMDTVELAHRAPGGPYCMGALSFSNFLLDREGGIHLFGFGHNFPISEGTGRREMSAGICWAPEVLLGADPTPASDVFCLHTMLRLLMPYVSLLGAYAKAAAGVRGFLELRRRLTRLSEDASAPDPTRRIQTVAELRDRYREIRAIVPGMPAADGPALIRRFARLVERSSDLAEAAQVQVDRFRRTVRVENGDLIELQRRRVLWCIFIALVDGHRQTPDVVVTYDELQARAWPDEKIIPRAARSRVYVAVSDLRKRGLSPFIMKREGGYLLAPSLQIRTL